MALNQKQRVEEFIDRWCCRGDEKQETQLFWLDLMQNVLGFQHAIESTKFEYKTAGNGFIDVLCPDTRFLVEQKSSDVDLDKPEPRQGTMVTPIQQAVRYSDNLPLNLNPSKICVCNFQRFRLYDLESDPCTKGEPVDDFALEDLYGHFGSLMEETLSHDQRSQGGMHYTTVKNIHRVIDPLFLDGLSAELDRIEKDWTIGDKARSHRLRDYQDKLAGLKFLERNFISFLCFYHLVRGSQSRAEEKTMIVVIDNPASSMDLSTLYIVGSLVREMIEVCFNNTDYKGDTELGDYIKQIFILMHNVYFHSEVTYEQEKNFGSTSIFKILKTNNTSSVVPCVRPDPKRPSEDENYNPIQNSYMALWVELKEIRTAIPALNVIRQILEYYCMQMCGYDRKELRQRVLEGEHKNLLMSPASDGGRPDSTKYHLADSMLRYISNPTGFGSEIHLIEDYADAQQYIDVFKLIFETMEQGEYYKMMMEMD